MELLIEVGGGRAAGGPEGWGLCGGAGGLGGVTGWGGMGGWGSWGSCRPSAVSSSHPGPGLI